MQNIDDHLEEVRSAFIEEYDRTFHDAYSYDNPYDNGYRAGLDYALKHIVPKSNTKG